MLIESFTVTNGITNVEQRIKSFLTHVYLRLLSIFYFILCTIIP